MPDVQEVFRMSTQKVRPDPGALERQHHGQRRRSTQRKAGTFAVVALLVIAGVVVGINTLLTEDVRPGGPGPTPTPVPSPSATPIPSLPFSGAVEPGTYVVTAIDPEFDAAHRITISVPDGYQAFQGWGILKDEGRRWVSASVVGNVYADACHWKGTLLDPPVGMNFDALVAALANQRGVQASTPTDVTLAGYAGKHMVLTVPAGTNLGDCDNGQFRFWLDAGGGERNTPFVGEHDQVWILDVDGVPLVIEAASPFLPPFGGSAQKQAELIRMVESIRIDPH